MKVYDFGIAWVYTKDEPFVNILKKELKKKRKKFLEINYTNVDEVYTKIGNGEIKFKKFLDLGSFEHPVFSYLSERLSKTDCEVINPPESVFNIYSKSKLHEEFVKAKLPLRKTFIIKPSDKNYSKVSKMFNKPFVLSPSVTSIENGVALNVKNSSQIETFMEDYEKEDVLAHEYLLPGIIEKKIAWFRIIYSCGKILPHWWDPMNHFYIPLKNSEKEISKRLETYTNEIQKITKLNLFSTEILLTPEGKYVIIDYANHPMDLGLQDEQRDALPRETLIKIAKSLV